MMHRGRHSLLGYLAPRNYINQEVSLPEPVVDLALVSSYSGKELPPHVRRMLSSGGSRRERNIKVGKQGKD